MFIAALLYFIPSVIGILRKHHNLVGLIALNILLGWTVIGWVGALIWSFLRSNKGQTIIVQGKPEVRQESKYEMLERLNSLKNSGAISEEKYDIEKSQLLSKH
ncbi:MAG: superinfection immunity protein [Chryseobacterium sp.]